MMDCNCKVKPLAGQVQLLMETQPDFPKIFKEHLVFKSAKVANPFKFIGGLLSKGVLCDGTNDSEANFGLKETMVQFALMIACAKGADAIGGLMESLAESGNSQVISALRAWVKENFGIDTEGDFSKSKDDISAPMQNSQPQLLAKQLQNSNEWSPIGAMFIDKIMSRPEKEFMEQIQGHLVGKCPMIVNAKDFCSILVSQNVLDESDFKLGTGQELVEGQRAEVAIKATFSKRALGSLVAAYQLSGNENVIQETLQWLQTSEVRKKNYPVAVKSLADQRNKDASKLPMSAFFEQAVPSRGLRQVGTLACQPESSTSTKGPFALEFNKEEMAAYLADGAVKLWNWLDNESKTINFGPKLKAITWFQYDEEVAVLGTAEGTVHLYDAKTLEEKSSVGLGEPVHLLKFLESAVIIITRGADWDRFWWVDISRVDMQLLNKRSYRAIAKIKNSGLLMRPGYSFLYNSNFVTVQNTKSGFYVPNGRFEAPAEISTLNVVDFITTKENIVAGCNNGLIALWNNCLTPSPSPTPVKNLRGHTEAIVSLCAVNGHLVSLDQIGKLLIWSGYDLEDEDTHEPVALMLSENFSHVTSLVAHERWLASSSSDDAVIKIWTLSDLCLQTGKFL